MHTWSAGLRDQGHGYDCGGDKRRMRPSGLRAHRTRARSKRERNLTLWIIVSRIGFRLSDWCHDAGGSVKPCKERLETIIGQLKGQAKISTPVNPRRRTKSGSRVYWIVREPVMRMSTSLLALCCQLGPDATWETPISARSRSNGSRSLRMSPLFIARFTNESIAPLI